jgi:hypothetical protein
MMCTVPGELLKKSTAPSVTCTIAMFATVCPATQFKFDANTLGGPLLGCTVNTPNDDGAVTVTLRATAVTPDAGTPAIPATYIASV